MARGNYVDSMSPAAPKFGEVAFHAPEQRTAVAPKPRENIGLQIDSGYLRDKLSERFHERSEGVKDQREVNYQKTESPELQTDDSETIEAVLQKPSGFLTKRRLLFTLVVSLVLIGLGVSIQGFLNNREVTAAANGQNQNNSTSSAGSDKPSEEKPNQWDIDNYTVAGDLPRYLIIEKLGIKSKVYEVGTTDKGELGNPNNIYDAGWYSYSSKPGAAGGAALIDGHESGVYNQGIFYDLKNLETGDVVSLERGDGQTIRYTVVSKRSFAADKLTMAEALVSADTAKHGLNLMTSAGQFDAQADQYKECLLVQTVQI